MINDQSRTRRINRRLNAQWPGHRRPKDDAARKWALGEVIRAAPQVQGHIDVVVLQSMRRRCEVLHLAADDHVIVLDIGYLSVLATIARFSAWDQTELGATTQALMAGILGWSFFVSGNSEVGVALVAESLRNNSAMAAIKQRAHSPSNAASGVNLFVLMHEAAHALCALESFDRRLSQAIVSAAAQKVAGAAEAMKHDLERGQARDGWQLKGYVPQSANDVAQLQWQIETYQAIVDNASELSSEVECDVIALSTLLDLRFGSRILEGDFPRLPADRLREVGDVLMIGLRALRAMQMVTMVRSEAVAITNTDRVGSFSASFAELTARQQIGTTVASDLFAIISEMSDPSDAPFPVQTYRESYLDALANLIGPGLDPILNASNHWFEIARDPRLLEQLRQNVYPDIARYAEASGTDVEDHTSIILGLMRHLPF